MSKLKKVWAILNMPVSQVVSEVGEAAKAAALAVTVALTGVAATVSSSPAMADASAFVADAQTGITQAKTDALTVGGYVIAAIALLVAVSWVLSMLKKR